MRDDRRRAEAGINENLMDDVQAIANIFIGNEDPVEFEDNGDYTPFLKLVAEYHYEPENARIYYELMNKIKLVQKLILDLRVNVEENHKKARHLYKMRE